MSDWAKLFKTTDDTYAYSFDGDTFEGQFSTREEALSEGSNTNPVSPVIYTGVIVEKLPSEFMPDADEMLEFMMLRAYDMVGDELAEGWPVTSFKDDHDLKVRFYEKYSSVLDDFFDEFDLNPHFYLIEDVVKHDV